MKIEGQNSQSEPTITNIVYKEILQGRRVVLPKSGGARK